MVTHTTPGDGLNDAKSTGMVTHTTPGDGLNDAKSTRYRSFGQGLDSVGGVGLEDEKHVAGAGRPARARRVVHVDVERSDVDP